MVLHPLYYVDEYLHSNGQDSSERMGYRYIALYAFQSDFPPSQLTLTDLNVLEVAIVALFYQFTLYVAIRLAHRGFTLGELSLVCFGGTALFMEFLNLTISKVRHRTCCQLS